MRQPPKDLDPKWKKTWRDITTTFEIVESDWPLLEMGCVAGNEADRIALQIEKDGGFVIEVGGKKKVHPGTMALEKSRTTFLRCWRLLGFPVSEAEEKGDHIGMGRPSALTRGKK